jgi:hypothetical protein
MENHRGGTARSTFSGTMPPINVRISGPALKRNTMTAKT